MLTSEFINSLINGFLSSYYQKAMRPLLPQEYFEMNYDPSTLIRTLNKTSDYIIGANDHSNLMKLNINKTCEYCKRINKSTNLTCIGCGAPVIN